MFKTAAPSQPPVSSARPMPPVSPARPTSPSLPKHEMQIFQKIGDWQDYTLLLIEKLPNKYNTTIKDGLFRLALEVIEKADMANQIKVVSRETRQKRLLLQNEILAKLMTMDRYLQLAIRRRALSPKQLENWAERTLAVRNYLLAWIRSDHMRYAKKYF